MTATRIVPLEIGRLDADLAELIGTPGRAILPVPAWVIEHPAGVVLFDTGMHQELKTDTTRLGPLFTSTLVDFHDGEELPARLAAAGYRPSDIDIVVISHLHFDHAGGAADVPDARLVVQAAEWKAAHHPRLIEAGLYNPADFEVGHAVELIDGRHDVFDDGAVVCLPTPGHTRGHQALRVQLASGTVVLTADCVYFGSMLDDLTVPAFGFSREQQVDSMLMLRRLRDDEGCRLLFGHDLDQFRSLPASGWT